MSFSLYDLTGEWLAMRDQLTDAGFDETTIADTLDAESGDYDQKVAHVAMVIEDLDALADGKKALAAKFTEQAAMLARRADSLKAYLKRSLATTGRTDIPHELIRVKLYIGRDKSVDITDEDAIPVEYMKTKTETYPDKTALKAALSNGATIEGAALVKKDRLSFLH